ncbi:MAG: GWxTD domain-containing protein [Bacteroidota bacterium]
MRTSPGHSLTLRLWRCWVGSLLLMAAWGGGLSELRAQQVSVDLARFWAPEAETGRLHVYTGVRHADLTFYRVENLFEARYQVSLAVYATDERERRQGLVEQETWTHRVTAATFDGTQQPNWWHSATAALPLRAGTFSVEVRLEDLSSGTVWTETRPVHLRAPTGAAVSDLVVMDGYLESDQVLRALPAAQVSVDQLRLRVGYEVYTPEAQTLRAVVELVGPRREGGRIPLVGSLLGLRREADGPVQHTESQVLRVEPGATQQVLTIPLADREPGPYLVRLRVQDERGEVLDMTEKAVDLLPPAGLDALDLNDAVAQLRYIAKPREIDHILTGATEAERRARLVAFWQRRDPTPRTARNERMMEYYHRLQTASRWWSGGAPGWQTDRGHVFVLFGEPDLVDRIDDSGSPAEVWHYTRIGRRFVFVGQADGQFKLRIPLRDERTRIR